MSVVFSKHALEQLEERRIPRSLVEQVLLSPEQKIPEFDDVRCYQSRVSIEGKAYLLRVMVNERTDPSMVITVYRTSKVGKYWRL